jgi:hypothetical protein
LSHIASEHLILASEGLERRVSDRQTDRQTETDRQRQTEGQTDRQRQTDRDRQRDRVAKPCMQFSLP